MRIIILFMLSVSLFVSAQDTTPLEKSPFPLEGTLLMIETHGDDQLATQISFYNDSKRLIKGFTGLVQFIINGEVVSEVMLEVQKDMAAEENTSWYGAIPYDGSNPKDALLLSASVDDIEIHIVVKAVYNENNVQRVY